MYLSNLWFALLAAPWGLAAAALLHQLAMALLSLRGEPPSVLQGKYSVEIEGDFVVFVIGIYLQPGAWLWRLGTIFRAGRAMDAMKRELSEHPEYGCMLVNHTSARTNPTHLVQIWRSYDHLADYARNRMAKHLGPWLQWNVEAKGFKGAQIPGVGIFHEAYLVSNYEAIYRNMPRSGLAKIGKLVSASHGRLRTGKGRLNQTNGDDHAAIQ